MILHCRAMVSDSVRLCTVRVVPGPYSSPIVILSEFPGADKSMDG